MEILHPRDKVPLTYEVYIGHRSASWSKLVFNGIYRIYYGKRTLLKAVYHKEDIITKNKWRGFWFVLWYDHTFINIELYDKYFSSNKTGKAKGESYAQTNSQGLLNLY